MCYGAFIYKVLWRIKEYFLLSQTVEQSGQCIAQETQFYFQLWPWHKIHDGGKFTSPTVKWGKESCFTCFKKRYEIHWLKKTSKKPVLLKQAALKHSVDEGSLEAARKSNRGNDSFKEHISAISSFSIAFLTATSPKFLLFPLKTPKVWLCPQAGIFIWN